VLTVGFELLVTGQWLLATGSRGLPIMTAMPEERARKDFAANLGCFAVCDNRTAGCFRFSCTRGIFNGALVCEIVGPKRESI
jgi:hypothetical protein